MQLMNVLGMQEAARGPCVELFLLKIRSILYTNRFPIVGIGSRNERTSKL